MFKKLFQINQDKNNGADKASFTSSSQLTKKNSGIGLEAHQFRVVLYLVFQECIGYKKGQNGSC